MKKINQGIFLILSLGFLLMEEVGAQNLRRKLPCEDECVQGAQESSQSEAIAIVVAMGSMGLCCVSVCCYRLLHSCCEVPEQRRPLLTWMNRQPPVQNMEITVGNEEESSTSYVQMGNPVR